VCWSAKEGHEGSNMIYIRVEWRREERVGGETQDLVRSRREPLEVRLLVGLEVDGGGLGGISSPGFLGRRRKRQGAPSYNDRWRHTPNRLRCLNSGARRISRGWCTWPSASRRFRHNQDTHTLALCAVHVAASWSCRCAVALLSPCCHLPAHVLAASKAPCPPDAVSAPATTRRAIAIFVLWRYLCCDWQNLVPARRRGYRWASAPTDSAIPDLCPPARCRLYKTNPTAQQTWQL
jgi:hypothetical protein